MNYAMKAIERFIRKTMYGFISSTLNYTQFMFFKLNRTIDVGIKKALRCQTFS